MEKNIKQLRIAIECLHKCKATYIEEIAIIEKRGSDIVWSGIVHVFRIVGHSKIDICYAWSSPIEGSIKRRYYTVLKIVPIDSPEKAVRAAIVADYRKLNDKEGEAK